MKKKRITLRSAQRFIIDYEFEDDKIKVYSTNGEYRYVKKNKTNMNKIDHAIIKNKLAIANKIDDFEATRKGRRAILLINMFGLCFSGCMVPAAFFTGSLEVFMFAILLFSFMVLVNSSCGMSYFILLGRIRKWKMITGYKKNNEFELPSFSEIARLYVKKERKS